MGLDYDYSPISLYGTMTGSHKHSTEPLDSTKSGTSLLTEDILASEEGPCSM
jgi:hypothetical protein